MKFPIHYTLTLLAGLGMGMGAVAADELRTAGKPPAYYITQIELTADADGLVKNFEAEVSETLAPFGGRSLVRGANAIHLEGDLPRSSHAVIQFDSMEQAQAWYYSPYHQMLISTRQEYTKTNAYLVEGVPQ